jgi:hypothetical protein
MTDDTLVDEVTQKVVDAPRAGSSATSSPKPAMPFSPRPTPTIPSTAPRVPDADRLLRGALKTHLEHGRPTHPELICTCHETIKILGENPDNHYLGTSLDGRSDFNP